MPPGARCGTSRSHSQNNIRQAMSLSIQDELKWIQSLNASDRARFLARLSHEITIVIRLLSHEGGPNAEMHLQQIYVLNETHHRVAGHLLHYHSDGEHPRWADGVVNNVLNQTDPVALQQAEGVWLSARESLVRQYH